MKKLFKLAFVAAIVAVAGYNVYKSQSVMNGMSDFALANVEALAGSENEERGYETRVENTIEIWDDKTNEYHKIITIVCEGKGLFDC